MLDLESGNLGTTTGQPTFSSFVLFTIVASNGFLSSFYTVRTCLKHKNAIILVILIFFLRCISWGFEPRSPDYKVSALPMSYGENGTEPKKIGI